MASVRAQVEAVQVALATLRYIGSNCGRFSSVVESNLTQRGRSLVVGIAIGGILSRD